jgi:excisionase family DNA binding protein
LLLHIGDQVHKKGHALFLSDKDLKAHAHGIGASRAGKSKLIEYIARQFIKERQGFCLIDPGGFLYQDLIQWRAYVRPTRSKIVLLDPSYEKKIVGFNPLQIDGPKNETTISAKVDRIVALTTKALGMADLTNAPRLERVMRCMYYVLIEQDLSLEAVRYFLSPRTLHIRDAIIDRIQSEAIKDQWLMLTQGKRPEAYLNLVESTANRLFKVLTQPSIKRIIGVPQNSINVGAITNNRNALLVNLQPSFSFSQDAARMIGTFLVNEIWETVRKRTREEMRKAPPFYLLVDEFQSFATPDFAQILDQGAKYGLHLILFHQNLNQLDNQIRTAMTACHSRFVFGGITSSDANQMLEGSRPTFEDLHDDISSVPSLPARHYILKRPDQPLINAFTPEVEEYRVPEDKIERYVESMTAGFLSPEEVDKMMQLAVPVLETTEAKPAEQPVSADNTQPLKTQTSNTPESRRQPQEKKQHYMLTYERARGTKQHRETQRIIGQIAETYGFRSQIEKTVLDGTGAVDVSLEKDGLKIACEVSVTTSAAWESRNVLKCLRASYDRVIVVASHPKNIPGLTAKIRAAVPVIEQEKIKILTLADFLGFLREIGSPADPNTGKPGKLAGARLDFKEAAEVFDVSKSTLYRWVQAGRIPFIRIGRIYQFDRDVLVLLGRHDLSGKRKAVVNLEPLKIDKATSKTKKQQDDRYRKMLDLD